MLFYCSQALYPLIAQLVEQLPFKEMVVGSNPTEGTMQLTFSLGFFCAVLFFSVLSGKYEGDKIERSLRFSFGKNFIHIHHWILGFLVLMCLFVFNIKTGFLYGMCLGTIFQGLCYRDRFVIFYKKQDFEKIYSKWKK